MFHTPELWDARMKIEAKKLNKQHVDWLCDYSNLMPLISPLLKRPRAAGMVLGSGISYFPEEIYDAGIKEVVVLDFCAPAMEVVRKRNEKGGRLGLYFHVGDPGAAEQPQLKNPQMRFDLIVDKGTLDITLAAEDGWERSTRAIKWVFEMMRTPGTLIMVSHSPPNDRINFLNSVFWHDIQFKMVRCTTLEELLGADTVYKENLVDYPYAVPEWERQLAIRREAAKAVEADEAAKAAEKGDTPEDLSAREVNKTRAERGRPVRDGSKGKPEAAPPAKPEVKLPEGSISFESGLAFVYILEK